MALKLTYRCADCDKVSEFENVHLAGDFNPRGCTVTCSHCERDVILRKPELVWRTSHIEYTEFLEVR